MTKPVYRRVVVKVSGEALMGPDSFGIHQPTLERVAADLIASQRLGVAIAVVVGGGNIFRGVNVSEKGIARATGDMMGMLATVMNALALETAIEKAGPAVRTMAALTMPEVCETYERRRALRHLEHGRMVLLAGGTFATRNKRLSALLGLGRFSLRLTHQSRELRRLRARCLKSP